MYFNLSAGSGPGPLVLDRNRFDKTFRFSENSKGKSAPTYATRRWVNLRALKLQGVLLICPCIKITYLPGISILNNSPATFIVENALYVFWFQGLRRLKEALEVTKLDSKLRYRHLLCISISIDHSSVKS